MYQFVHIEAYGRKGAHAKNSSARKASMFDVRDEMIRAAHACPHVPHPKTPELIFGRWPTEAFDLASERAAQAIDKLGRRLRIDALIVLAGVCSWPVPVVGLRDLERYRRWRNATVNWLRQQWGDHLVSVVEHTDEPYPHLHYVVVPELDPDRRLRIETIHAGYRAVAKTRDAGGSPRDQKRAFQEGMRGFQDSYYSHVGARFGLTRIGPRRQRLSRAEWNNQKRQTATLARAHARLEVELTRIKAKSRDYVRARTTEAESVVS